MNREMDFAVHARIFASENPVVPCYSSDLVEAQRVSARVFLMDSQRKRTFLREVQSMVFKRVRVDFPEAAFLATPAEICIAALRCVGVKV